MRKTFKSKKDLNKLNRIARIEGFAFRAWFKSECYFKNILTLDAGTKVFQLIKNPNYELKF